MSPNSSVSKTFALKGPIEVFVASILALTPLLATHGVLTLAHAQPPPEAVPVPEGPGWVADRERTKSVLQRPVGKAAMFGGAWQAQGPGFSRNGQVENIPGGNPVCGAINTVAPHPTNADILYVGGVNGGIWRTTNATATSPTWTPLTDQFPSLSIGDLEFDPTDANHRTLVAGIGGFSSFRAGGLLTGILRTTDGGDTWTELGQTELAGRTVWALVARGNKILVGSNSGLYRSTDRGGSFQNISGSNGLNTGPVFEVAGDPGDNERVYVAVAGGNGGVFRSDDIGANWTNVTDTAIGGLVGAATRNMQISVSAASGNAVFVAIVNGGRLAAVFRSANQGGSWTAMDLPQTMDSGQVNGIHPGGQGQLHFSLLADATNGNIVYVGGDRQPGGSSIGAATASGRLFRGDASIAPTGGVPSPQWTPLTHVGTASNSSPHADSRDMDFDANGDIVQGDDGGVYRRTSPRATTGDWFPVFGDLQVGEFHSVAYDANFDVVVGGTQDTGTPYQTSPGSTSWTDLTQADGGIVAVDHALPGMSTYYYSNQNLGGLRRRTCTGANVCGGATTVMLNVVAGGATLMPRFYTPIQINSQDRSRLLIGALNSSYESFNQGDDIRDLSSPGVDSWDMVYGHPDNPDLIVVGVQDEVFVRTTAGGNLAATPTPPPGGGNVIDIAVDPADANVIHIVDALGTVARTTDGGINWTDITGSLNTMSGGVTRSVAYIEGAHGDLLAVGTLQGVFASLEPFGGCWFELGSGLPHTFAWNLDYDSQDDRLVSGLLGRGTWSLDGVAQLEFPAIVASPNGGETFFAGCPIDVTWTVGVGFENENLNILYSRDGGRTFVTLLTNTPNDGNDVVILPCGETSQGRIMIELADKTVCDASDDDFEVVFPSIAVNANVDNVFDPPDPWVQDGLIIDTFAISSDVDLFNVHFEADPLQCRAVPCEVGDAKRIHGELVEFVPEMLEFIPAGQTVVVEVKTTVPIGQHACTYEGLVHVIARPECGCPPEIVEDFHVSLDVLPVADVDVADNHGNVSDNVLHLVGAKETVVTGTFTVVNPNSEEKNTDRVDGPGNIRINPIASNATDLVKIGDPAVNIGGVMIAPLVSLGAGEAQAVTLSVVVPDGIPVNALYQGTVEVSYESCLGGDVVSDKFTVQLEVLPTQGPLDILETELTEFFCPDDPWTMTGQVEIAFRVHANGDHRNVRVSSGGLRHESLDKKLDNFNFFPEEFALIAAGETREARVIIKIPVGQHTGVYTGAFQVVSESGGEDLVTVSIEICPIFDLDIKDNYANLGNNIMQIQAISRANSSGGEWVLRAFDIGLPSGVVNNHDEFDGPGNVPVDCITCTFGEWSPLWHEDDHDHHFHNNFTFNGVGSVNGNVCAWSSGEFRRLLVGLFVPRMMGNENGPGTYKGRLDCWAVVDGQQVAHDFFDIEVQLARVVGPGPAPQDDGTSRPGTFGAEPNVSGALLYWGDFTGLGLTGNVNLYREDADAGAFDLFQASLPQSSSYLDDQIDPESISSYKLGVEHDGGELFIGPIQVGGKPRIYGLGQNFPNPFRGKTVIRLNLPENGRVSLKIFDARGRLVRTLKDGEELAGFHSVGWDRSDDRGQTLASGIYFYRLTTPKFTATRKMLVLR